MSRNNQKRISATDGLGGYPAEETKISAGLSFPDGSDVVELPSRGIFYKENHPNHGLTHVQVAEMTMKDEELISRSKSHLSGETYTNLVKRLIRTPGVSVDHLLVGDLTAIIYAIRFASQGDLYLDRSMCPKCSHIDEEEIHLSAHQHIKESEESEYIEYLPEKNVFKVRLPKSKKTIEFRQMIALDQVQVQKEIAQKQKLSLEYSEKVEIFKKIVQSVDGDADIIAVRSLAESLPARDGRYFDKVIRKMSPDLLFKRQKECPSCGHVYEREVPVLPVNFRDDDVL